MADIAEIAPAFTLPGTKGQTISLQDYLAVKRVLLLFYHNGHAGCCGDRLPSGVISSMIESLEAASTIPLGIAIGTTLSAKTFLATLDLPFPFLIDEDGAVHAAYGALAEGTGKPQRFTVLVGRSGRVVLSQWGSPSPDELMAVLAAAADDPVSLAF